MSNWVVPTGHQQNSDELEFSQDYEVVSKSFETSSVYKYFIYLRLHTVTFKIVPLHSKTALPAFLPLLQCVLEVFFSKRVKHLLLFTLNLRNGVKTTTFELDLQLIAASP